MNFFTFSNTTWFLYVSLSILTSRSTITPVIFIIILSLPYLFGGTLVWMNAVGTSKTLISSPLQVSIFAVKKKNSGDAMWLEVSSLDKHYIAGFPLDNTISLGFSCALMIQYQYILLSPTLILWHRVFNIDRHNIFNYKVVPYPWSDHHTLLVKYLCENIAPFFTLYYFLSPQ